jgi:uncharacterized C2H2 Zn-finger protein
MSQIKNTKKITINNNCDHCDKKLETRSQLLRHIREVHKIKSKTFKKICNICNNTFTNIKNLSQHLEKEHGIHDKVEIYQFNNSEGK